MKTSSDTEIEKNTVNSLSQLLVIMEYCECTQVPLTVTPDFIKAVSSAIELLNSETEEK